MCIMHHHLNHLINYLVFRRPSLDSCRDSSSVSGGLFLRTRYSPRLPIGRHLHRCPIFYRDDRLLPHIEGGREVAAHLDEPRDISCSAAHTDPPALLVPLHYFSRLLMREEGSDWDEDKGAIDISAKARPAITGC